MCDILLRCFGAGEMSSSFSVASLFSRDKVPKAGKSPTMEQVGHTLNSRRQAVTTDVIPSSDVIKTAEKEYDQDCNSKEKHKGHKKGLKLLRFGKKHEKHEKH